MTIRNTASTDNRALIIDRALPEGYTDCIQVTFYDPARSDRHYPKVIAKSPGNVATYRIEDLIVIDSPCQELLLEGTTVEQYRGQVLRGYKYLSYKPVASRPWPESKDDPPPEIKCHRTACDRTGRLQRRDNGKLYCPHCARNINEYNPGMFTFPKPP